ncbi:MAG: hypothetical protein M3Q69_05725 [Acidobacteriota bacterium]|nr:hypothetical protein [Acidobacteriota bacterium]
MTDPLSSHALRAVLCGALGDTDHPGGALLTDLLEPDAQAAFVGRVNDCLNFASEIPQQRRVDYLMMSDLVSLSVDGAVDLLRQRIADESEAAAEIWSAF